MYLSKSDPVKPGAVPTVFFRSSDNQNVFTKDVSGMMMDELDQYLVDNSIIRKESHPKFQKALLPLISPGFLPPFDSFSPCSRILSPSTVFVYVTFDLYPSFRSFWLSTELLSRLPLFKSSLFLHVYIFDRTWISKSFKDDPTKEKNEFDCRK